MTANLKALPEDKPTISDAAILAASADFFEENKRTVRRAENVLDNIEKDIMSDMVVVPVLDEKGYPTGTTRLVSMQSDIRALQQPALAQHTKAAAGGEVLLALEQSMAEAKATYASPSTVPAETAKPEVISPMQHTLSLDHLGLGFLTDPPSLPACSVRLQLEGPMKFSTAIQCHAFIVTEQFVILVTDTRVKADVIDIVLEDAEIEATLITETEIIPVLPPVPFVITYSIGVLKHHLFIRKITDMVS